MLRELRYGVRQLRRRVVAPVIILLIGLSIGSNLVVFAFINELLLKTLPVRDPQSLFIFEKPRGPQVRADHSFTYVEFQQVLQRKDLFPAAVAEQVFSSSNLVPLGDSDHSRLVMTQIVSPNYFSELGIHAVVGRLLDESDPNLSDIPIVLSYQFWQSQFGGTRDIVGRAIRLKNHVFVVVGVLPRAFHDVNIDQVPDVRLPVSATTILMGYGIEDGGISGPSNFEIVVRLAPGISPARAASSIATQLRGATEWQWTQWNSKQPKPMQQESLRDAIKTMIEYDVAIRPVGRGLSELRDYVSNPLKVLMGTVGLLFGLACANIACLLSATFQERRKEVAIRLSLGATRAAVVRQLVYESLILVVPGVVFGVGFALVVCPTVVHILSSKEYADLYKTTQVLPLTPNSHVLIFAAVLSTLCLLALATASRWLLGRMDLTTELKGNSVVARQEILQKLLLSVQVALTVVLFYAGGLAIRSFWSLQHVNVGFDPSHVVEFDLDPTVVGYSGSTFTIYSTTLLQRIRTVPGVHSCAYAAAGLMRGIGMKQLITPVGTKIPSQSFVNTSVNFVTSEYFESLSIPFLAGRDFADFDADKQLVPIVVNVAFANTFFPHQNAVDKQVVFGWDGGKPPNAVIVGIVGSSKYRSVREEDPPTYYAPWSSSSPAPLVMYVRSIGEPAAVIGSIRETINRFDKSVPIVRVISLEQQIRDSLWRERLMALLSGFFGLTALLVASLGLYAVLASSIKRRTRELGVRIAIGAQLRDVTVAVCGRTAVYVGGGLVLAGVLIVSTVRISRSSVYGLDPFDLASFLTSLSVVTLCSSAIAAMATRRASNTDPAVVLREE
jgi:predicted permease